jgi:hypothetical protein
MPSSIGMRSTGGRAWTDRPPRKGQLGELPFLFAPDCCSAAFQGKRKGGDAIAAFWEGQLCPHH